MTAPVRPPHWLIGVARRAKLPGAEGLDFPSTTPPSEAWRLVSQACHIEPAALAARVAAHYRLGLADMTHAQASARKFLPESLVRRFNVFPLREDDRQLLVATGDPNDMQAEQDIAFASGRQTVFEVAAPGSLGEMIDATYSPEQSIEQMLRGVNEETSSLRLLEEENNPEMISADEVGTGPVVQLVNLILQRAVDRNASDIHLQPAAGQGIVRYRVDGVLSNAGQMPLPALNRVISRIKVMGKLDVADRLRPQDGRARIAIANRTFDLRISTIPARSAEKCVIRILDAGRVVSIEDVGILEPELSRLKHLLTYRDGIVVVTGPTGSGKTTTMYAALRHIAGEDINIMTVEDPIEYELSGLTQIQVEPKQGVTFASALRAILRQDPDVIFIGEIRDTETAAVAAQASLTGHLVLATLHTNDAVGAIRRLADLGLDSATISTTMRGVIAQRLVRRLNPQCVEEIPADAALTPEEERLATAYGMRPTVRASDTATCRDAAFRGRLPVIQVLEVTPAIEAMIASNQSAAALETAAELAGMRTLRAAGLARVAARQTTLGELERVLGDVDDSKKDEDTGVAADGTPRSTIGMLASQVAEAEAMPAQPHVLVIDDDGANRTIARALLQSEHYRVTEAVDGAEGLVRLRSGEIYNLVILDLDMPNVDGREVLKQIRSDVATAGLPVIILTATSDPDAETVLLEQGADDYIRKPFDPRRFLGRVKATMRRSGG